MKIFGKIACMFSKHPKPYQRYQIRNGKNRYRCTRCGRSPFAFYIDSAEGPRMLGLRKIPKERRQAAVDEFLRRAK